METIHWNTGRGYTADGQRMAATYTADGRVHFADLDRGICGITQNPCVLTPSRVMWEYDNGRYNEWPTHGNSAAYYATCHELEKVARERNNSCGYK